MKHRLLPLFISALFLGSPLFPGSTLLAKEYQVSIGATIHAIPLDQVSADKIVTQTKLAAFLASPPKGSDLLSAPSITTLSGNNAQIEVVREIIYATEYNAKEGALLPSAFETRETGIILNVTPTVSAGENPGIVLSSILEICELTGWQDARNPQHLIPPFTKPAPLEAGAPAPMLMPVFASYNLTSAVSLESGQSIHFAGGKKEGTDQQYFVSLTAELIEVKLEAGAAATEKQLRELMLPRLEFREANIKDVVQFLTQTEGAPNIILKGPNEAKVSLSLANVSMRDALHFLADITGLSIRLDKGAVILAPKPKPPAHDPFGGGDDPFGAP